MRHAYLPDAASGVYAPGWDISVDDSGGAEHLASYGLGSPFPEDSKLCAALSSFWPAVAPDAARSFWDIARSDPTISPLTDEEIGQSGNISWDGATGPRIINVQNKPQIEYLKFDYVDYVNNMLQNKFTLKRTGQVDISKYKSRILALAIAYKAIPSPLHTSVRKEDWPVISFKEILTKDQELEEAQTESGGIILQGDIYRMEMCSLGNSHENRGGDFKKVVIDIKKRITFFVGSGSVEIVLFKEQDEHWRSVKIR
jgi:hypothetical protein